LVLEKISDRSACFEGRIIHFFLPDSFSNNLFYLALGGSPFGFGSNRHSSKQN
jgi:hypothetical protein